MYYNQWFQAYWDAYRYAKVFKNRVSKVVKELKLDACAQ